MPIGVPASSYLKIGVPCSAHKRAGIATSAYAHRSNPPISTKKPAKKYDESVSVMKAQFEKMM